MLTGFVNGNIYVSFNPLKKVEALLVANEKILYAGSNKIVENIIGLVKGKLVDLKGKTVLPGFIDSHMHLDELGMYLNMLNLRGVKSIRELKRRLEEYLRCSDATWIVGHGWDHELFEEKRLPTRYDLDEVVKDKPVMLSRICMHTAVLNTKAMEITGLISMRLPGILLDENGVPTGIVKEDAFFSIAREKFKENLTLDDYEKFFENAMEYAASKGVTTVGFVLCDLKSWNALTKLNSRKSFPIRVRVYLHPGEKRPNENSMYANKDVLEILKRLGIKIGFGNTFLKILGIKVVADGGLGARTAWLTQPFSDDPSTSGYPNLGEKMLMEIVNEAHEAGLQVAVHGIGDKTIDMILNVYRNIGQLNNIRHRIEHASVLRNEQADEIASLNVPVSVQPHFIITDWWAKNRVGEERIKYLWPFKTMVRKGIIIGLGTDCPVEPLNPWETVYAAVTRGKYDNIPYYEDTKEECLTLEETLHAYTWGSAYIMHEESSLGCLEEGKFADFIVVNKDPFTVRENELKDIEVIETYVGGKCVWKVNANK
ncbi:MAG: amidohydrolase [Nitrososphaeria archaeon]|nr:amidohydrolase [Nitrososphaeria archaeon]